MNEVRHGASSSLCRLVLEVEAAWKWGTPGEIKGDSMAGSRRQQLPVRLFMLWGLRTGGGFDDPFR